MSAAELVDQVLDDVAFIAEHWDDLLDLREPGTSRPWRQALLDPERKAAQAARDRDERAVRDPDAPGFTSAPQHVEVLDVIVDAWTAIDELVALVSPDWRRTRAGGAVPRGREIARITEIADMVSFLELWVRPAFAEPLPKPAAEARRGERLRRLARRMAATKAETSRALGLVLAGQLLAGAVCPFCAGVTPKHPEGGAITMRVEEIAPAKSATDLRPAVEAVHAVVCWNPLCEPDSEHCGTRYRGRPAWPWHEWEWLAPQLIVADPPIRIVAAADPPTVIVVDGQEVEIVPVVHSGRTGLTA